MITAILTGYNRPRNLPRQVEALKSQSTPPEDIFLWYNQGSKKQVYLPGLKSAHCTHNFKYHGRFAMALLAQTEYVAIFDDDTIPGRRWFENCLACMRQQEGIYGTAGVVLDPRQAQYVPHWKVGCNGQAGNTICQVDLVGHAWFFRKEWLRHFWAAEPLSWDNGEDIQFSFYAQKFGGINTYVPPHPPGDRSLWGSTEVQLGADEVASYRQKGGMEHLRQRNEMVRQCVRDGWKLALQDRLGQVEKMGQAATA